MERKLVAKEQIENGFDLIGLEQLRVEHKKIEKKNLDLENDLRRLKLKEETTTTSVSQSRHNISTVAEEIQVARHLLDDLDRCIAQRQKELSTQMKERNEIQTTTKWKAKLASNTIVRENYELSTLEEKKMHECLDCLDCLKTRHYNLTIASNT